MKSPNLEELALLPEPLAVERHFDAKNYRLFRWMLGICLILSFSGIVEGLRESRYALLTLSGLDFAAVLALFAVRREPFFFKSFRQILLSFLLLQLVTIKVSTSGDGDNAPAAFVMFSILLIWFRMRPTEHIGLYFTTWLVATLPPGWLGLGEAAAQPEAVWVIAVTCGIFLLAALGLSALEKRQFLPQWRREHARQRDRLRMVEEVEYARRIQLSMLPQKAPDLDWLELAAVSLPATEVGGDYYDYFRLPDGRLALVIGDVAGHGVASGLLLSGVRSCLYLLEEELGRPVEILTRLNSMVRRTTDRRTYVTLLMAVIDPQQQTLTVASAGHPPVFLYRRETQQVFEVGKGAPPLGTFLQATYVEVRQPLQPGDLLLFYTDGMTEAGNGNGQFYGPDRLQKTLARAAEGWTARAVRDALLGDLSNFKGDTEQEDDTTLVVARIR
ncbi:MAG TPA: PP2C family protein-serine/threonine phosphatase [Thermoanaerobaculia bacterium]|nr:PP2C family protein-serine/threonine phosphatase [Thermoanaerobaculia bacterium]